MASKFGGVAVSRFGGQPVDDQGFRKRFSMPSEMQSTMERLDEEESEAQRRALLGEQFYDPITGAHEPTSINDYELNDPGLRFKLSRTEKLSDALNVLQRGLPEGDVAIGLNDPKTGGRVLGFLRQGEEGSPQQFYTVDSPNQITLSDVADAGGVASLETLFAVGGALLPHMRAAGWAARTATDFASAFFGKQADEALDVATGLEEDFDAGSESAQAGVINAVFGRVADAAVGLTNIARGAGATGRPERGEAVQAAIDQALPAAQVGGPLSQRATAISENIGSGLPLIRGIEGMGADRRAAVAQVLEGNALEREIVELGDTPLMRLIDSAKGRARKVAERGMPKAKTKQQGGEAVMEGIGVEFAERSKVVTDKAYDDYMDLGSQEGQVYDLTEVIASAEKGLERFKLAAGTKSEGIGILDANGTELTREVNEFESFSANLDSQLAGLMEQLRSLDALQGDPSQTAKALKQIRSNLIDLAEKDPFKGGRTQSQGVAAKMLNTIHEAIVSPEGATAGVREAYEKANALWRARAKTLDAFAIKDTPDTVGAGEMLFNRMTGNLTEEHARVLKRELSPERFAEFQGAVIDDLLRDPRSIESKLTSMGRGGEVLVPPVMRDALRIYQRDIRNIDKGVLASLLETQGQTSQKVGQVIESGNVAELKSLTSSGVIKNEDVSSLIFQDFLDKTTHFKEGKLQVDPSMFATKVEKLKSSAFWKQMTPGSRKILNDLEVYSSFLKSGDSGSSIAAAEIAAAQLQPVTNLPGASAARLKQIQIGIIANIANSKTVSRVYGLGNTARPFVKMRASVIGILQVMNKMVQREKRTDG